MAVALLLADGEALEVAEAVEDGEVEGVMAAVGDALELGAGDGVALGQLPSSTVPLEVAGSCCGVLKS